LLAEKATKTGSSSKLYASSPSSTQGVLDLDLTGEEQPTDVSLPDRSTSQWKLVKSADQSSTDRLGEAAISMMFYAPALSGNTSAERLKRHRLPTKDDFTDVDTKIGNLSLFNYSTPYSSGWIGGSARYYKSENGGEMASIWRTEWASKTEAQEFKQGYLNLIRFYGATVYSNGTAKFSGQSDYNGVVQIRQTDNTVTIVQAPTFENVNKLQTSNGGMLAKYLRFLPSGGVYFIAGAGLILFARLLRSE
jgi:hypothetical protein